MADKKIIIIAGATASGKTELAVRVAKAVNGEIISADSMQVYKNMPIATAAPTEEEKSAVPHHLTEFLEPDESFSVAAWCTLARQKIDEILSRGRVPIIAGGTGLFIDSLADNIIFEDTEKDDALRQKLMQRDAAELYGELERLDPEAAANVHMNNKKRVARALELYYSGVSKTQQNINSRREASPYKTLYLVLDYADRQALYERINRRVDMMLDKGLAGEAEESLKITKDTAAQAIGHKELEPYFSGEISFDEAVENLKRKTRNYAKRQITWFKRRKDAVFITLDGDREEAFNKAIGLCEEFING
jgi:tRNA dimethylallyltransferase